MPLCYTYARASHRQYQVDTDSVPDQNVRTLELYERNIKPLGVAFGKAVEDLGRSAYKTPFHRRPGGNYLVEHLEPGDHLVIDKVDRIWRSLKDFTRLYEWFKTRMVTVHFVNLQGVQVSSDTPMGEFTLSLFVMVAQLESAIKSERNSAVVQMRRAEGKPHNNQAPLGMRVVFKMTKKGKEPFLEWDEQQRGTMAAIVHMRDVEKLPLEEISCRLCEQLAKAKGVPFSREWVAPRPFNIKKVQKWYQTEKAYRAIEASGVTSAPEMFKETIKQSDLEKKRKAERLAKKTRFLA